MVHAHPDVHDSHAVWPRWLVNDPGAQTAALGTHIQVNESMRADLSLSPRARTRADIGACYPSIAARQAIGTYRSARATWHRVCLSSGTADAIGAARRAARRVIRPRRTLLERLARTRRPYLTAETADRTWVADRGGEDGGECPHPTWGTGARPRGGHVRPRRAWDAACLGGRTHDGHAIASRARLRRASYLVRSHYAGSGEAEMSDWARPAARGRGMVPQ